MARNAKGQFVKTGEHAAREFKREYSSWSGARQRCYNPKCARYKRYGGRGIKMCERWRNSFDNFLEDMGRCPDGLTLDRIDLDGDYEPSNCRWADKITQATNRSVTRFFEYNGESLTIPEMSRRFGIKKSTLAMRIYSYGWSVRAAIETEVGARRI
jgi:hypothetical protein